MQKILITGATGLIGQEIVKVCHDQNLTVHYLSTSKKKLSTSPNYKGFYWNPNNDKIDSNCFEGVDTIINLVGATISKRWTDDYKQTIVESRTQTAKLLKETIAAHKFPVQQIVSASAIGVYPDSLTNYYEEDETETSSSFLGDVVQQWEAAVDAFSQLGIKVAKIRIGLVLSEKGGALPEIAKPIRFGAGAAFGTGEQWQSWIHIQDLAQLFVFAVTQKLEGVYNAVAPNPVTNNELTKAVAKVLHRPLILPNIPKLAMKLVLGEMHILLFESQRVSASKIEEEGFNFEYHHLEPALLELFS
ncbi:TIGR01777 family oxidoreductase [Psychroserpens sp. SPM9]|uniref:TIGR01777 family oxidoreductase n=1 Tax=Psychroserpens sp. SPM9 TaxID=2975598 RepID=UPI0021A70A19|nr:TIGR01777 family oxidoreductase [Psychroserpens sp. SPM9]MDG5492541.1 TIGR01777 family oxidoreductase [Psychroserpens sp. SPM9]